MPLYACLNCNTKRQNDTGKCVEQLMKIINRYQSFYKRYIRAGLSEEECQAYQRLINTNY